PEVADANVADAVDTTAKRAVEHSAVNAGCIAAGRPVEAVLLIAEPRAEERIDLLVVETKMVVHGDGKPERREAVIQVTREVVVEVVPIEGNPYPEQAVVQLWQFLDAL